ncbi:MAG: hypothetical protein KKA81_08630 [Bacteroidetes bacterium]|nr:hypothetical protein [Bacteroidota bacterium]
MVIYSCEDIQNKQNCNKVKNTDNTLIHTQNFTNFNFNIFELKDNSSESEYQCFVQLSKTGNSYFLFETTIEYINENLQYLYENYYAFPYFSGGNYCRAMGLNIIKVTQDTAFNIGPVSGYDDIDSNGIKELYIDVATDLSGSQVNYKIEQFEVLLVNDSLVYLEIDLY